MYNKHYRYCAKPFDIIIVLYDSNKSDNLTVNKTGHFGIILVIFQY
jgi:hypothetical protein